MRGKSIRLPEPGSFLKRMLRGLRRGTRGRDDALAVLRHELRTPLTGILGMASLLRESRLDSEQLQWLTAMEQSGRQLANLLERPGAWLASGTPRVDTNAGVDTAVSPTTFNGLQLLENMIRAHAPAAHRRGIGIFLVFDHRLRAFWHTDPVLLQEVLDNLLANAIKFTPSGLVLLEARRCGRDETTAQGLELRVSDTGPGIPRGDERRVYAMGVRGSEEQVRQHGGSGYGLFICNCIAAALGGSLNHVRLRSGGTRFSMRLPGAVAAAAEAGDRLRPRLLKGLRCGVSLPAPADRAVAHALRRMDIRVSFPGGNAFEAWPEALDAWIGIPRVEGGGFRVEAAGGSKPSTGWFPAVCARPVLQGRLVPDGRLDAADRQRYASWVLREPLLHANLEPLMLQFALHMRRNGQ